MSDFEGETHIFPLRADSPYQAAIGRITTAWSDFEFEVNRAIWELAGIDGEHGVCLTAQIYSIQGRINALIALAHLEGASKTTIGKLNKFASHKVEPLSQKRNRIVHDPWCRGKETEIVGQILATAQRKLDYRIREVTLEYLKATWQEILRLRQEFLILWGELHHELVALRAEHDQPPSDGP